MSRGHLARFGEPYMSVDGLHAEVMGVVLFIGSGCLLYSSLSDGRRRSEVAEDAEIKVRCRRCREMFRPDLKTTKSWRCPSCDAGNPNLRRHFQSLADVCVIGVLAKMIFIAIECEGKQHGVGVEIAISAAQCVFIGVLSMYIYKSIKPWVERRVVVLVSVLVWSLLFRSVIIALMSHSLNGISSVVGCALACSYWQWLKFQAGSMCAK